MHNSHVRVPADPIRSEAGAAEVALQALAGERAAHRVLRRIRDGIGGGDELLAELRDVMHDDGHRVPATTRLRSFLRVIQKEIEQEGRLRPVGAGREVRIAQNASTSILGLSGDGIKSQGAPT